ncbi:hypothetical protein Y032_0175g489 [Ancylostoma ceylanicum]|uniref:Uncharacterized protein n=1 Tax=Ancylostoma ceylanicum TaxID=53326 RepID=A0A016SUW0_9BILA|nr:hypothetical protein Y032_0175g489 [Ancylostoma ceylanicum]
MDGDDDIEVIYESCNNETWKSARDRIKSHYRPVGQSTGFNRSACPSDKSVQAGYGKSEMWRDGGGAVSVLSYPSCSSAMSSASSARVCSLIALTISSSMNLLECSLQEASFASSAATQMDPLAAKVEIIDLVDADDGDTNSVEVLEDSDSTMSGQTVCERRQPSEGDEEDDYMPLFETKNEIVSDEEAEVRELANLSKFSDATTVEIKEQEEDIQVITPPPTKNDVSAAVNRPDSTRSAAEVWREACRSSMSSCSVEEEKPPVFPMFSSAFSTVSECSSLARDVVHMNIGADSRRRSNQSTSPAHDEVSSSSDVIVKLSAMKATDTEGELARAWAETHDLGLDGDEFLDTEDETAESPDTNQMETEIVELTSEKPKKRRDKESKKSHRSDSSRKADSDQRTKHKVSNSIIDFFLLTLKFLENSYQILLVHFQHRQNMFCPYSRPAKTDRKSDSTSKRSKGNHRKRSSSSGSRSTSRPDAQASKRFAAGRSRERPTQRFGYVQSSPLVCKASSAPKAKGLPRYIPVDRKYDFTRWLDAKGELVLHKIKDVATGLVSAPLGCAYDEALDTFVFTRHDSILFSTCEGRILNELTLKGFDRPCAVSVLRPGQALGILDRSNLYLYEHHMRRLSVLATGLNARHRALTYTSCGDFVTVRKVSGQLAVTIFDATNCDTIIASLPYPRADGLPNEQERQPCFADTVGRQIFFTDLRTFTDFLLYLCSEHGTNTLTCVELTKDTLEKVYSRCMQRLPNHRGAEAHQRFLYMSGVRCDDSGHILVADARAHSLTMLTSNGQFMKKARIADGGSFPYCSSFGVSTSGFLMACDRANNRMILYRIGEETTPENAILTDDVFDRMIGRHGVEDEVRRLKEAAHRFS